MSSRKRKHELSGAFLALPMRGVLDRGGLLDTLSPEAFKLFILALTLADRVTGDGLRAGGVKGPRRIVYKLAGHRLNLHPRKVSAAFKELLGAGVLEVAAPATWKPGIREATVYEIGWAHPWSRKAQPTSNGGSDTDSNGGSRSAPPTQVRIPTVEARSEAKNALALQREPVEGAPIVPVPARLPTVEERSRSPMGLGPKPAHPGDPAAAAVVAAVVAPAAQNPATESDPARVDSDVFAGVVSPADFERRKAEMLADIQRMQEDEK